MITAEVLFDRLFRRFRIDEESGCWLWIGSKTLNGYGNIGFYKFPVLVHRLVAWLYLDHTGDSRQVVRHRCNVKNCFNPDHLCVGTYKDNFDDAVRDGLIKQNGMDSHFAKLNESDVRSIRWLYSQGITHTNMARLFKISRPAISLIVERKNWAWLEA